MASVKIFGEKQIKAKMAAVANRVHTAVGVALYNEGLIEMAESMARTPVKTGALRGSHITRHPEYRGQDVSVTIEVGGPAAPYAVVVHEDLEAFHPTGQAKYLESTIMQSAPFMLDRISKRLKAAL